MTLCLEQPIIASVFDQPPGSLHQPLLQAGERPPVSKYVRVAEISLPGPGFARCFLFEYKTQ